MSIKIMAEVWDHAPASNGELLFLLALADQAGDEDRCAWPGAKQLARRSRCHSRTVYKHADSLIALNVLERVPEGQRPERYRPKPGRETTVWRIKPSSEWQQVASQEVGPLPVGHLCPPGHPTPGAEGTPPLPLRAIEPSGNHQRTVKKNPRTKVRADEEPAAAGELDLSEPDSEPELADEEQALTAWGLAKRFTNKAEAMYPGKPAAYVAKRGLQKNITAWRKSGVELVTIKAAIDRFFDDRRFHEEHTPLWQSFVNSWVDLADRAARTTRPKTELPEEEMVV